MRLIILITALLFCGYSYSQDSDSNTANNQPQSDTPQPIEIRSEALDSLEQSVETIATNTTPDESAKQRQERSDRINTGLVRKDLAAQRSMADSTSLIMWFTGIGMVIGFLGLIMIGLTLKATNEMVSEAKSTTSAAFKSAEVAETMGQAQVRAYLEVESFKWMLNEKSKKTKGFEASIINCGQSPAKDVELIIVIEATLTKESDKKTGIIGFDFGRISAGGNAFEDKHGVYIIDEVIGNMFQIQHANAFLSVRLYAGLFWWDVFDKEITDYYRYDVSSHNWQRQDADILVCSPESSFIGHVPKEIVSLLRKCRDMKNGVGTDFTTTRRTIIRIDGETGDS